MIHAPDDFLIDRVFQPLADRLARWTTADALGRQLLTGTGGLGIVTAIYATFTDQSDTELWFLTALMIGIIFWLLRITPHPTEGTVPAARKMHFFLRLTQVILLFVQHVPSFLGAVAAKGFFRIGPLIVVAMILTFLFGLYFMACCNNPPKRQERTARGPFVGQEG